MSKKGISYKLEPTPLIPNSPYPLVHYPDFFSGSGNGNGRAQSSDTAVTVYEHFLANGWETQWVARYGLTQPAHYHSKTHECMAVLSGTATIRFGAADADPKDDNTSSTGSSGGSGCVEVRANAGDVFIIPAGVSHKTFDAEPAAKSGFLTPGDGHGIAGLDARQALGAVKLDGFTMIGAYPRGGRWDFSVGGEHTGQYEAVWAVAKPARDPVLGEDGGGLCGLWR